MTSSVEAIHNKNSLSNIEKMNYLIGYLEGEAEITIRGLQLPKMYVCLLTSKLPHQSWYKIEV